MTSREEAIEAIAQMEFRVDVNATNSYWVAPKILDHPTVEAYYREKLASDPTIMKEVMSEPKWVDDVFGLHTETEVSYIPLSQYLKESE